MSDAELIEELIACAQWCDLTGRPKDAKANRESAARLEKLTAPRPLPGGSPLEPAALADVREEVALGLQDRSAARGVLKLMLQNLLAGFDHALAVSEQLETMVADSWDDSNVARMARQAGVAQAVAVIHRHVAGLPNGSPESARLAFALGGITAELLAAGRAELPPHEKTLMKAKKMEAALREITDGLGLQGTDALTPADVLHVARKALEEG